MPSLPSIQKVEDEIGIPVVSAAVCTAHQMLTRLGLETRVPNSGALLSGLDADGACWFACDDLANQVATNEAVDAAIDWLGGLDALVNVAGAFDWKKIEDSSIAD